jgi:hypothetical protein
VQHALFALAVLGAIAGCGDAKRELTEVPIYPGATLRSAESAFQERLLALLGQASTAPPRVQVYETPAAFAAVTEFYEPYFTPDAARQRFAVASRMRELAAGARTGGKRQIAVGRLLFERDPAADSLGTEAIADSLAALAERLGDVQGLIMLGRISLATRPRSEALISIERPHLDPESLAVDSLTVVTIAVGP